MNILRKNNTQDNIFKTITIVLIVYQIFIQCHKDKSDAARDIALT